MEKTLDDTIKEGLAELPPYIKTAIQEVRPTEKMRLIGESNRLHIDQQTVMEREVMLAMLGLIEGSDFVDVLSKEGGVDTATAQKIATDISNQIFIPIRNAMRRAEEANPPQALTESASPAIVQSTPVKTGGNAAASTASAVLPTHLDSAPAVIPPNKSAPHVDLPSVDTALNITQSASSQRIDVGITPPQTRSYENDPYLEPIE